LIAAFVMYTDFIIATPNADVERTGAEIT